MNKDYWEGRYQEPSPGWDIGFVSSPLKTYIDQLEDRQMKILVPGAGFGHEVAYLWQQGYNAVYALDIAKQPLDRIRASVPGFPDKQLLETNFFALEEKGYDLVLEQTFFCSLPPVKRKDYVKKMHGLLKPGGKLAGLLFDFPLSGQGPPFGGSTAAYKKLFSPYFKIHTLERAYNSIPPRQGTELFFIFEK